ncbi:ABC transporter ATP-binding protein [Tissierella sp. MB52-C2]|uniref:ABC transporter ATP-binding protein n=1 Tax=Tissierella sp. MB52-C2 TaxID=3070999 RepID=UPI00280AECA0|nr:ABC transporter ATP-binding protein [Tissierella sp. MB52-C2]WMM26364.1 ABC transporter ATP-binding protein [Tissierella sp. MB52-C2]
MEYILETNGLTKSYKKKMAVDHVNLHVKKGEIYGFVGPNGAGKSTILKMILNLTKPDSGEIKIFGETVSNNNFEILKRIGSIIENPYFYDKLTGRENLKLHCEYMGYHNKGQIDHVLEAVSLTDIENKAVAHYSLGMKQRLATARAILTKPQILILDEPINALDPEGIREMRSLFRKLNEEWGISILISSHILSEVELIADTIGVIQKGRLLKEISIEDIHDYSTEYMEAEVSDTSRVGYLLEEKLGITNYKIISDKKIRIFDMHISGTEISGLIIQSGIGLESIRKQKNTLEDYFFQLTEEDERL